MKFAYDLHGFQEIVRDYPVFGNAADIVEGAIVMRGATPGTNQPFAIVASGACADVIGLLKELHDYSVDGDSNVGGTTLVNRKILINPFAVFQAEYDQTDTMAVVSSSGTTVTITSIEDNIDGGWVYAVAGTGKGQLQFITAADGSTITTKTASGWDSTTTLIKILPLWHQLGKLNTAGDKLGTDAAVGSAVITNLDNWIQADTIPFTKLDPTLHSGLTGLDTRNVKFYSDIIFRDHALNTID